MLAQAMILPIADLRVIQCTSKAATDINDLNSWHLDYREAP